MLRLSWRAVDAAMGVPAHTELVVVCAHLTPAKNETGAARRALQIADILHRLQAFVSPGSRQPAIVLCGDFNSHREEECYRVVVSKALHSAMSSLRAPRPLCKPLRIPATTLLRAGRSGPEASKQVCTSKSTVYCVHCVITAEIAHFLQASTSTGSIIYLHRRATPVASGSRRSPVLLT